ncbi:MAG: hypothetical protein U0X20_06765 [Caldilineaceae bacterium]
MAHRIVCIVHCTLFALVLWFVLATGGAAAQGARTPYQAHVLMPRDFVRDWSPLERAQAWDAGLPVPDIMIVPDGFTSRAPSQITLESVLQQLLPWAVPAPRGWSSLYHQSFPLGFPAIAGSSPCRLVTAANAIQHICVFDQLKSAQNLMVQFTPQLVHAGDTLFVGVSTDGVTFYGRRWRGMYDGDETPWPAQRLFAPFIGAQTGTDGRVAVLWEFRAGTSRTAAGNPWLDEVVVEQYTPATSSCRSADPRMQVAGVPGNRPVSKGINLPAYPADTPSGLEGHVARLRQSGVQWVRVEWQVRPAVGGTTVALEGPVGLLNYLDLRHYDDLLGLLCDSHNPIGVLGLLDYAALPNQEWRAAGHVGGPYVDAMSAIAGLLARYYGDCVGYWEIWNEPDFQVTHLAAADYAHLLTALYSVIKQVDPSTQVVFGGLGGADWVAAQYFGQVIKQFSGSLVPYDVFAIHPYPSKEFRRNGRLIRDPSYLYAESPTILAPFMAIMRAAGHSPRPIWITELGWNRAADSSDPATLGCQAVYETMVTGVEQATFLPQQFDILFKDVTWAPGVPAVAKIFWYQYMDVGLELDDAACQATAYSGGATRVVDWWFGLYSGTDWRSGIVEPQPNLAECSFRAYPSHDALSRCLSIGEVAVLPSGP